MENKGTKRIGTQTIKLSNPPKIISTFSIVGPKEGQGPLREYFDDILNDAYTSTGLRTHRDPNGISTVAIDPTVIAYGSKLYIPGYGYAIAADCGGAIKGNRIDLFMLSEAECFTFGRRSVTVYLVAGPGEW